MPATRSRDRLAERAELAAAAPRDKLEPFLRETASQVLIALARNPNLQESDLLRLLNRKDISADVIKEIAAHKVTARSYPVKLGLAQHPKTPFLIASRLLKFLYLFDLLRVCQTPGVRAEVKRLAEEYMLKGLDTVPRGEKIVLARRAPGRVAAQFLVSEDCELIRAALDNPFLSEADVLRVLPRKDLPSAAVESIALHPKWSCRYHLRLALVRNPLTPLSRVLEFLPDLTVSDLQQICLDRAMPEQVRNYIVTDCAVRLAKTGRRRSGK